MPGRNKGFDPLSSLFEAPEPGVAPPAAAPSARSEPDTERTTPPAAAEVPDPGALPAPGFADAETLEDVRLQDLGRSAPKPEVDKAAIARAVAVAAAARLQAQPKAPSPAPGQAPDPGVAPRKRSRLDSLAARAVRPRGDALAAARAAAAAETREAEHSAEVSRQAHVRKVRDQVESLVPTLLPGVPNVRVVNAIIVDERGALRSLWMAHRTRFIGEGQLERAVGAAVVLQATASVSSGNLVAAHVETTASDYLVWIDVARNQVLAAFPDARAYFAAP